MIAPTDHARLIRAGDQLPVTLDQHEASLPPALRGSALLDELEASGLAGRGGAAFPTARKVRLLREQRSHNKFVVVNVMEGEPASHKDLTLTSSSPHLILDGAQVLASLIGATHVAVCAARDNPTVVNHLKRAMHERERRRGPSLAMELHTPPWRYVAGEESALTHWLDDKASLPQYRPHRPHVLRLGRAPVLVDNAETCAHVGLIARYGANWFRALGTVASPGTTLVSISGAVTRPTVFEVALGTPLRQILIRAGADAQAQAVLLGGYGGSWLDGSWFDTPYANESLSPLGASVGAGVIVVLPRAACGVRETQRIVTWMANESARQCGPCAFGLPALAEDLARLSRGSRDAADAAARLVSRGAVIEGRGACHHPDGVVRLVRSALEVFAADVAQHQRGEPCAASRDRNYYAAVPSLERAQELVWE